MAFNGSGVFNLVSGNPVVTGTTISSTWANNTLSDVATGLSNCVTRDGQSPATANLPMGGYKLTGLALATATGDALSYGRAATVTDFTSSGTVTLSGGTANGVAYLNASKQVTTGSALTFDGTNLAITQSGNPYMMVKTTGAGNNPWYRLAADTNFWDMLGVFSDANDTLRFRYNNTDYYQIDNTGISIWNVGASEQMRLTSTGLGIGTSSPNYSLTSYKGGAVANYLQVASGATGAGAANGLLLGVDSSGNSVINAQGAVNLYTYVAGLLRTTIDSSGNLGLGVTPSAWRSDFKVQQIGSYGSALWGRTGSIQVGLITNGYLNSSGSWIYSTSGGATSYITDGSTHAWNIAASGTAGTAISFTQAMTLDANGNLLVGTTSAISGARVSILNVNAGQAGLGIGNTGGSSLTTTISFRNSNGEVGTIQTTGTATVYNTSSDQRLKTDLGVATSTDVIENTLIHDFEWKTDGSKSRGVFAQEAHVVKPEAVSVGKDELNEDGLPVHPWGVDYSKYVPDLIVYCQQLKAEIESLTARITTLEAK